MSLCILVFPSSSQVHRQEQLSGVSIFVYPYLPQAFPSIKTEQLGALCVCVSLPSSAFPRYTDRTAGWFEYPCVSLSSPDCFQIDRQNSWVVGVSLCIHIFPSFFQVDRQEQLGGLCVLVYPYIPQAFPGRHIN